MAWGPTMYTTLKYDKDDLTEKIGSPVYWLTENKVASLISLAAGFLCSSITGALVTAVIGSLAEEKTDLEDALQKIKDGEATYLVVKQEWVPGVIYGYYEKGDTTVTYE